MKIRVLGGFGAEGVGQRPSSFLVNDQLLVDAGAVTSALTLAEQHTIECALVSHAHLDHVVGLAYLSETLACDSASRPLTVASVPPVIDALAAGIFNNVVWPDFTRIPSPDTPVVQYRRLVEEAEQRVCDLWVTPVTVNHTVPTSGFVVHDGERGFIYSGDTGPTDALWKACAGLRGLGAVIIECAYPNRLARLAEIAKHLTPDLLRREIDKLPADVPIWVFHVKPQFFAETADELSRVAGDRVSIIQQDKTYIL